MRTEQRRVSFTFWQRRTWEQGRFETSFKVFVREYGYDLAAWLEERDYDERQCKKWRMMVSHTGNDFALGLQCITDMLTAEAGVRGLSLGEMGLLLDMQRVNHKTVKGKKLLDERDKFVALGKDIVGSGWQEPLERAKVLASMRLCSMDRFLLDEEAWEKLVNIMYKQGVGYGYYSALVSKKDLAPVIRQAGEVKAEFVLTLPPFQFINYFLLAAVDVIDRLTG